MATRRTSGKAHDGPYHLVVYANPEGAETKAAQSATMIEPDSRMSVETNLLQDPKSVDKRQPYNPYHTRWGRVTARPAGDGSFNVYWSYPGSQQGKVRPGRAYSAHAQGLDLRVELRRVVDVEGEKLNATEVSTETLGAFDRGLKKQIREREVLLQMTSFRDRVFTMVNDIRQELRRQITPLGAHRKYVEPEIKKLQDFLKKERADVQKMVVALEARPTKVGLKALDKRATRALTEMRAALTETSRAFQSIRVLTNVSAEARAGIKYYASLIAPLIEQAENSRYGRTKKFEAALQALRDELESGPKAIDEVVDTYLQAGKVTANAGEEARAARTAMNEKLAALHADVQLTLTTFNKSDAIKKFGFALDGRITVRPRMEDGQIRGWDVAFLNTGPHPWVGTVVFAGQGKYSGMPLESMAVPNKGSKAIQSLTKGCNYGVTAQVGQRVRIGVRGYGWFETALPKKEFSIALSRMKIEGEGKNSGYLSRDYVEEKRDEKARLKRKAIQFFEGDAEYKPPPKQRARRRRRRY